MRNQGYQSKQREAPTKQPKGQGKNFKTNHQQERATKGKQKEHNGK